VRDSRRLGAPQQAQPEERRSGATWKLTAGIAGRCGKRGNPNSHQPASRGKRSFGATRGVNLGKAGRCRIRGDPKTHREAALEGEDSGEPGDSTPGSTKDARFGAHRRSITGKSRKTCDRGNLRARREAVLVQRICGATRVSKASSADECENRGNSRRHCRHGLKNDWEWGDLRPHLRCSVRSEGAGTLVNLPQAALQGATSRRLGEMAPGLNGR